MSYKKFNINDTIKSFSDEKRITVTRNQKQGLHLLSSLAGSIHCTHNIGLTLSSHSFFFFFLNVLHVGLNQPIDYTLHAV
jgi:hypothetical protein